MIGDQCATVLANWMASAGAVQTVLAAQAGACLVAAGFAWIPWGGQVPM
jgi:hypothetical protein